jgi:alkanesulfonate monooxygenase SsuD/methylene tetrahydromethanopterin reductase-like flavin-dependent oxidoreductase (luciferase family)
MHLTISLNGSGGFHPAAWRLSATTNDVSAAAFRDLTTLAERGGFAAAFFGLSFDDAATQASGRAPLIHPDALPLVASLIAHTRTIGLGATFRLERSEPFNIARSFATLDRLSLGRTAWIIELARPSNDGRDAECIEVAKKLWDSWEDGAFVVDKARGLVAEPSKVHRIDHAGAHFSVRGPLNGPRPTQGYPVMVVIDPGDDAGRALVARVADLLVVNCSDGDSARRIRHAVRSLAAAASRDPDAVQVLMNICPILGSTEADAQTTSAELGDTVTPGLAFVGTPEQLADRLADLHAGQACDGFNIVPSVLPNDLALIVERTIPLLQQRGLMPARAAGKTLRARLGLIHPRSRYAAQSA